MARRKLELLRRAFPEVMDFYVSNPLERSGILFIPADSHLRTDGELPDKMPTNGYCPSRIDKETNQEIRGSQDIPVAKVSVLHIRIVESYTGAPEEWTPAEIFEAIFPSGLRQRGQCRHAIMPVNGWQDPGYQALMTLGMKQARLRTPSLIPPMRKGATPLGRQYQQAAPVPKTPGAVTQGQFAMDAFNPLSSWQPPNDAPPISPAQLGAQRGVGGHI